MSDVVDRNAIRVGFAALLKSFYIPDNAVDVIDHYTEDLGGQSPMVVVADSGINPEDLTPTGYQTEVFLQVMHYVKKGEAGNAGYTKADADTMLSDMTRCLMRAVKMLQDNGDVWLDITFNGRTNIKPYKLGGTIYWGEFFELRFLAVG